MQAHGLTLVRLSWELMRVVVETEKKEFVFSSVGLYATLSGSILLLRNAFLFQVWFSSLQFKTVGTWRASQSVVSVIKPVCFCD